MSSSGNSPLRELVQLRTGRPIAETLRELYIEKRHTQQEIANAIGVSRSQVKDWLAEEGISRDDRPSIEPLVTA